MRRSECLEVVPTVREAEPARVDVQATPQRRPRVLS